MAFNPKVAWEHICLLSDGERCHHSTSKVIQIKFPVDIQPKTVKNATVFAKYLKIVLNNHKPTDETVRNNIELQEVMRELKNTTNWKQPT